MGDVWAQYRANGSLKFYADYRTGSLVDTVNGTAPTIAGSPKLVRGRGGLSLNAPTAADMLSYGTGAVYDLTTSGTLVCAFRSPASLSGFGYYLCKADFVTGLSGYFLFTNGADLRLGLAAGAGINQHQIANLAAASPGSVQHVSASWSAATVYSMLNGVPQATTPIVETPISVGYDLRPVNYTIYPEGVLFAAILNVTTTDQQRAEIYEDFRLSGHT